MRLEMTVNGQLCEIEADPRDSLLRVLRENLGLRGTKHGCGEGECGACTVYLNGRIVNSCLTPVGRAHGGEIVTIEGLVEDEVGVTLIDALAETGAVQCGFCTPGLVVSAHSLLARRPEPDVESIRRAISGNLCRCTGYAKTAQAVALAARVRKPGAVRVAQGREKPIPAGSSAHYARPATLDEALALLGDATSQWRVIAGGTDLLVQDEHRVRSLSLLDIGLLDELRLIREDERSIRIGALVPFADISASTSLQTWASVLVAAAGEIGGPQIQNMGTLGGNVVNASPAADGVPPLLVLDASVVLRSTCGERVVPVADFATGPGDTVITSSELLTEIIVSKVQHEGREITFYRKLGPRKALTVAKASVAFRGWLEAGRLTDVKVAFGAVAPTVMQAPRTAGALMEASFVEATVMHAGEVAASECRPIDDLRSTAAYRRRLVRGLLVRALWSELM
jgi:carbon-monoxide dehydrogenase small subunit/xanthine dehydrogenase small subunit